MIRINSNFKFEWFPTTSLDGFIIVTKVWTKKPLIYVHNIPIDFYQIYNYFSIYLLLFVCLFVLIYYFLYT